MTSRTRRTLAAAAALALTLPSPAAAPASQAGAPAASPDPSRPGEYPVRSARHEPASSAAAPRDADLIIGVLADGEARAYPLNLLWHEGAHTVNDDLGHRPVAVALCPLAGVGTAFVRRAGRHTLEIGHLAETERDTLVLYDTRTHSRWNLFSGEAMDGPLRGERLGRVPTLLTTWSRWKALHPGTTVYTAPEEAGRGFQLDAGRIARIVRAGRGEPARSDWIVGLSGRRETAAVLVRALAATRVVQEQFDGEPVVVYISADSATTLVWKRKAAGRVLSFRLTEDDQLIDEETGSVWDPWTGTARSGGLAGTKLTNVPATAGFWHAWKAHHPDTRVIGLP